MGVDVDGGPASDIFIDYPHNAVAVELEPKADEWIDESEIECSIEREIRVVVDGADVNAGVEFIEDDVFEVRPSAEHLGFPCGSAGSFELCDAVIDFEIAICELCFASAVGV